jgi:hypothetical protein
MFRSISLLALMASVCSGAAAAAAAAADVETILRKADAFRMNDGAAQVETLVQTFKSGQADKERRYQVLTKPGAKSLVLFRSPGEVGQKVLMVGDNFWMLLPGSARPIRITPLQKLLGDASTGDIATMRWSGDYAGTIVRELEVDGEACLELDLSALRKSVSYQRIVLQVAKRDHHPVHADLFAASNRRIKQARFTLGQIDGRPGVTRMTLIDEVQTGRETAVITLGSRARQLGDELFNPMYLSRSDAAL